MSDFNMFQAALRDLIRPKRLLVALALIIAPSAIALLWRYAGGADYDAYDTYNQLTTVLIYGFLLVILAVVFGTGVIAQEVEQKTIVYLLTRPVPRWRIILMRFLAAWVGITVTTCAATLLLAAVSFGFRQGDQSQTIRPGEIRDSGVFLETLKTHQDDVSKYLYAHFDDWAKEPLDNATVKPIMPPDVQRRRQKIFGKPAFRRPWTVEERLRRPLREINRMIIADRGFYDPDRFMGIQLNAETTALLGHAKTPYQISRLNRLLLEQAFPGQILSRSLPVFPLARDLEVLPVGALAYGAFFLLLATLLNRPMMYGLVFAFGWESWVPNLPGKFQMVSIMTYLRTLAPHPKVATDTVGLMQFLGGNNAQEITARVAWTTLVCVIVAAMGASMVIFSTNEYVPREDAE